MKKILQRVIAIIPAVCLQILWYVFLIQWLRPYAAVMNIGLSLLSVIFVLFIMSVRQESTYKTLWLLIILGLPITGTVMYLFFGNKHTTRPLQQKIEAAKQSLPAIEKDHTHLDFISDQRTKSTIHYLEKLSHSTLYPCQNATYYPSGEEAWKDMLKEMKQAKKFIFAEYFIVEHGLMWDSMVEIMARKVKEGVDVRVMYDDLGSVSTYSHKNLKELRQLGIQCIPFNPIVAIKGTINNRDHRKMLIIDGRAAFSGGINIADEYINKIEKYGHWKDIGFKITGKPVESYVRMFTEFWNAFAKEKIQVDDLKVSEASDSPTNGYAISYYDSPYYEEAISNTLYVEFLEQAKTSAWFYTPYLMLGDTLRDAFVRAAQRGIDVRIIVPGIPDKKLVYQMTRSNYAELLKAGVRIFEYTPGFIHAKATLIDDEIGSIGTVNLDYRSLFLHFENNTVFYQSEILKDLKNDFLETQEKCLERTNENWKVKGLHLFINGILQIFSPLC